jgi:hypothetical protein
VIPTEYDKLSVFKNGAVIAQKGGKFGVFMLGGKEILPFEYDAVNNISHYETHDHFIAHCCGCFGFLQK